MKKITMAVMSDLHVGNRARSKDLSPHNNQEFVENNYIQRFVNFVKNRGIHADYLIIPGDVTDSAHVKEYKLASTAVKKAAETLSISEDHILFVPGNHDVGKHSKYNCLRKGGFILSDTIKVANPYILDPPYYCLWEFDDLIAVGYDSSCHHNSKNTRSYGLANNKSLSHLEKALESVDLSPRRLRVFMVHHHPVDYSNPIYFYRDQSQMVNAEALRNLLTKKHFDLVIHGHKHCPRFQTISQNAGFPIGYLCSGSFSIRLEPLWEGNVSNQFHLLKVLGRDKDDDSIHGEVESWAYSFIHDWHPSAAHDGIEHRSPFGAYVMPKVVVEKLRPIIEKAFSTRGWIAWSDIITGLPRFKYLPQDRIKEALIQLSHDIKFDLVPEPDKNDFILLKKEKTDG